MTLCVQVCVQDCVSVCGACMSECTCVCVCMEWFAALYKLAACTFQISTLNFIHDR